MPSALLLPSLPLAPLPLLSLLLLAPLLEEAILRAGVQEWLLRRQVSATATVLLCALLFGAVHAGLRHTWSGWLVGLPALPLGLAYSRWRRLRICAALHGGMNALWLLLVLRWPIAAATLLGTLPTAWRP